MKQKKYNIKLLIIYTVNFFINNINCSDSSDNDFEKDDFRNLMINQIDKEEKEFIKYNNKTSLEKKNELKIKIEQLSNEEIEKLIIRNLFLMQLVSNEKLLEILNKNKNNFFYLRFVCRFLLFEESTQNVKNFETFNRIMQNINTKTRKK